MTTAEDAEYVELLWPVVPAHDVDGWLDWFTGVMALNVPHEIWGPEIGGVDTKQRGLALRTYAHEWFHFLQFSAFGFMHDWAAGVFELIRPVMRRTCASDIAVGDFAGIKRLIASGEQLLSSEERAAVAAHFAKLDAPGRSGLTTRAIFESHAYFVERTYVYDLETAGHWAPHLEAAPAAMYRIAFDVLAYAAGYGVAVDWFCAVAALALCTDDPPTSFECMAAALALASPEVTEKPGTPEAMIEFLKQHCVPSSCPVELLRVQHPTFSASALAIRAEVNADRVTLAALFATPQLVMATLRQNDALSPPIIFKPAPPSKLAISIREAGSEGEILAMFSMGAVGQRLTSRLASESRAAGDRHLEGLAWIVRDYKPIAFTLANDDLQSGDPSRMTMILNPRDEYAEAKRRMWGKVMLRLPPEIDPTGDVWLPTEPAARVLLKRICTQLPMCAVYFSPHMNGFYEWFGSVAPDTAIHGTEIDLAAPEVQELVAEAERAITEEARVANVNAWWAIECMVRQYRLALASQTPGTGSQSAR